MMTFSFAPVISLLQSASLDFVHLLSLTANKKSIYFGFSPPKMTSLLWNLSLTVLQKLNLFFRFWACLQKTILTVSFSEPGVEILNDLGSWVIHLSVTQTICNYFFCKCLLEIFFRIFFNVYSQFHGSVVYLHAKWKWRQVRTSVDFSLVQI